MCDLLIFFSAGRCLASGHQAAALGIRQNKKVFAAWRFGLERPAGRLEDGTYSFGLENIFDVLAALMNNRVFQTYRNAVGGVVGLKKVLQNVFIFFEIDA